MGEYLEYTSNIFINSVTFLTFFMNIKISDRVPCTEFIRPFYRIGYEKYFHDIFQNQVNLERYKASLHLIQILEIKIGFVLTMRLKK